MSIIQTREASYKDSNPDEIEIGNSSINQIKEKNSHYTSIPNSPFHNALDIELEMWSGCVKDISKIVQNQLKISKDIFSDTFEHRKDIIKDHEIISVLCTNKIKQQKPPNTNAIVGDDCVLRIDHTDHDGSCSQC